MVCRTDVERAVRYLLDAAAFYEGHTDITRIRNRARLMRNLAGKLARKVSGKSKGA